MQDDTFARCFAIARDAKLFNAYLKAEKLLERHPRQQADLVVATFLTAVVEVKSALCWLETAANLTIGTIRQLHQLAAALESMEGCENLSAIMEAKVIAARHDRNKCVFFHRVLSSDAAIVLAPIADLVNRLEQVAAGAEDVSLQHVNDAVTRCQELCGSHDEFALYFGEHGSALFSAYLQQSWQTQVDRLLVPHGTCLIVVCDCLTALGRSKAVV